MQISKQRALLESPHVSRQRMHGCFNPLLWNTTKTSLPKMWQRLRNEIPKQGSITVNVDIEFPQNILTIIQATKPKRQSLNAYINNLIIKGLECEKVHAYRTPRHMQTDKPKSTPDCTNNPADTPKHPL